MADDALRVLLYIGRCLGAKEVRGQDNWSAFLATAHFWTEQLGLSEKRILEIFRVGRKTVHDYMTAHPDEPIIHLRFTQPSLAISPAGPEVIEAERQPFETIDAPAPDDGIIAVVDDARQPIDRDEGRCAIRSARSNFGARA
jgi:hypothetical protein